MIETNFQITDLSQFKIIFLKIYEKVLYVRLYSFLDNNNLLLQNQFVFRPNHSTYLVSVIDLIPEARDEKKSVLSLYLALRKAFDTVDYKILLKKCFHLGIRGVAFDLILNYLTDRKQIVAYKNAKSSYKYITVGVPQGSVLGPLHFLVYINDIGYVSKSMTMFLFADDANALVIKKDPNDLIIAANNELTVLNVWFKKKKLTLNIEKTNYMIFTHNNNKQVFASINVNDVTIKRVNHVIFWGFTLDDSLSWSHQIAKVESKVSSIIGVLYKIRKKINVKTALLIYDSLIATHLMYCNILWRYGHSTQLDKIFVLQKRALKLCMNLPNRFHFRQLFKLTDKLLLSHINLYQIASFVHSVVY